MAYYMENRPPGPLPGPLGLGATNRPNYTMMSGGCYNTNLKQYVKDPMGAGAELFCAGDVEAMKKAGTWPPGGEKETTTQKILGVLPAISSILQGPQQPVTVVQKPTNPWIMPVALGAVAIGAVLIITKKPKPKQNPARRRRRRRRR